MIRISLVRTMLAVAIGMVATAGLAQAPGTTEISTAGAIANLHDRLEAMERHHAEVVEGMQRRIRQLEHQVDQSHVRRLPVAPGFAATPPGRSRVDFLPTGVQPAPNPPQPPPDEGDLESEVERMLREAEGGQPAPAPAAPPGGTMQGIESLLEQAEERRAEPAPELGAGLGAKLSAFNPNVSVIGDFAGVASSAPESFRGRPIFAGDFEEGNVDGFHVRELELLMTAAIDPYADGMAKLAFGEEGVEIEECYALFHDYPFVERLPRWARDVQTKIGLFRTAFGPMNHVDDHDLPTVDRPLAIQRFLGEEGLIRAGFSFSKMMPLRRRWNSELVVEFTHGEPPCEHGAAPPFEGLNHPLGLVHYKLFTEREPNGWGRVRRGYRSMELGATFATTATEVPPGARDAHSTVEGFDVTWQWFDPRPNIYRQYLLQSEIFLSQLDRVGEASRGDVGGYLLYQVRLNRQWFSGLRLDLTEFADCDGHQLAATPYLTYFISEFNRVRFQYQYLQQEIEDESTEEAHTVWFQLVFAFGAHPPEPYYMTQRF